MTNTTTDARPTSREPSPVELKKAQINMLDAIDVYRKTGRSKNAVTEMVRGMYDLLVRLERVYDRPAVALQPDSD